MTASTPKNSRPTSETPQLPATPFGDDTAESEARLPNSPAQGRAAKPPATNLVLPRRPLIGRDHEIAAIQQLLLQEEVGLLTLTGSGGIGKTRLAMQVAASLLDHFVDGVYFVSLAPIREADAVVVAIAETLDIREASGQPLFEALQSYLRHRQMLLVLDNFEQVMVAAPLLAQLLAQCTQLKLLVTSRATLHLYGEQEFPVPPLALPEARGLTAPVAPLVSALAQVAAVALFVERARIAKPDFALTENNMVAVAEICIRLDGLPLAIELAATRIKLFSAPALLARMQQQQLTLLTGGPHDVPARQRTLRAEIGWSYDLLEASEQRLFRHLAIFAGGFTLEAAQAVGYVPGDQEGDLLEGIANLVDQNLLRQVPGIKNEARFGMLETIREYGLAQLAASSELIAVQRAHAEFYLTLVEEGSQQMRKGEYGDWTARLECEQSNWLMALQWSQSSGNVEVELRMAAALWIFWLNRGYLNEDRHYLENLLERTEGVGNGLVLAGVLEGAGAMAWLQGDNLEARPRLEKSLALARVAHNKRVVAEILIYLGWVNLYSGDHRLAALHFEESLALAKEIGDKMAIGEAFTALGDLAREQGDYGQAAAFFAESLALYQEVGASIDVALAHIVLGQAIHLQGDRVGAAMHFKASLAQHRSLGIGRGFRLVACLEELAQLYALEGEFAQAACLCGAAEALEELIGASPSSRIAEQHKQYGAGAFSADWEAGRLMSPEQAIDYALALPDHFDAALPTLASAKSAPSSLTYPAGLTLREVEVLRLLAQGLTYSQIADNLVITPRTVNAHLTTIYGKLGVSSRAAATRFAIDHHLV